MHSVVVYESMYGNTRTIAERIAHGLEQFGSVRLGSTEEVTAAEAAAADLVVVGGPTHAHGLSSHASRKAAAADAAGESTVDLDPDASGPGLREWLKHLPSGKGQMGAAFDTRIDKPVLLTGSAAKGIAKRLKRHGFDTVDAESFLVADGVGPLVEGEAERAHDWAEDLATRTKSLLTH